MNVEESRGPNYYILTLRYSSSGQWDRALETSREWLAREPENLHAHRIAAQALINLKQHAQAEPHVQRVLAGNPNDDFAHRLMSLVHYAQGRISAADDSVRRAIAIDPHAPYNWLLLARMSYEQRDIANAKKCATKALELDPRNPDAHNLLILCEPNEPGRAMEKIRRYEQTLELDPENAAIHNNMGTQYLNGMKDYAKAEECFRRALFFDPTSALFRKNLFITVKHRDIAYRVLCAPKDFLVKVWSLFYSVRRRSILLYIVLIPLWLVAFRFLFGGLILWCILIWPLVKVYEYLTIGDIKARAGELGARRGGFLGYRKWPLKMRLGIFASILLGFWGSLAFLVMKATASRGTSTPLSDAGQAMLGLLLMLGLLGLIVWYAVIKVRRISKRRAARKVAGARTEAVENLLKNQREW